MRYRFDQIAINSKAKKKPVEEDKYHYIGLEHLDSGSLTVSRWGADVAPKGEKLIMSKGDVLFGKRRAYQKKVAIAPFDGIFSAHGMVLRPNEEIVDKDFFPMFISSDYFLDTAIGISVGSLSPTINWRDLARQEFELPSLEKQRELAQVLWAMEETKVSYQQLLEDTEELVKSRFIEMFGDINLNEKTWATSRMEDICESIGDGLHGTPKYDEQGKIPFINGNNLDGTIIHTSTTKYIDEEEYKRLFIHLSNNAILLSINGTLGKLAYYCGEKVCLGKSAAYFNVKHDYNRIFVYELMRTEQFQQYLESNSTKSTIKNVGLKALRDYKIITPPHDLQNQFADFVQQVDKSKFVLQYSMDGLL